MTFPPHYLIHIGEWRLVKVSGEIEPRHNPIRLGKEAKCWRSFGLCKADWAWYVTWVSAPDIQTPLTVCQIVHLHALYIIRVLPYSLYLALKMHGNTTILLETCEIWNVKIKKRYPNSYIDILYDHPVHSKKKKKRDLIRIYPWEDAINPEVL